MAVNLLIADADGEKYMSAADDRLVGVVGIQVETATRKYARQYIARRCDALTGGTPNA